MAAVVGAAHAAAAGAGESSTSGALLQHWRSAAASRSVSKRSAASRCRGKCSHRFRSLNVLSRGSVASGCAALLHCPPAPALGPPPACASGGRRPRSGCVASRWSDSFARLATRSSMARTSRSHRSCSACWRCSSVVPSLPRWLSLGAPRPPDVAKLPAVGAPHGFFTAAGVGHCRGSTACTACCATARLIGSAAAVVPPSRAAASAPAPDATSVPSVLSPTLIGLRARFRLFAASAATAARSGGPICEDSVVSMADEPTVRDD
jgi:hypothetical protein